MSKIKVIPTAAGIRFWTLVERGPGCWIWKKSTGSHGYGQFYPAKGNPLQAHRVSWFLTFGKIPTGMHVLHRCDNKRCVRPDHLFLGTHADNMRDKCNKGRQSHFASKGDACKYIKVTDAQVEEIRTRWRAGTRQKPGNAADLAKEYGVTRTRIFQLAKRQSR